MDGDWVRLHRKILDSAVFSDEHLFRLFIFCVLSARWKSGFYMCHRIERGQFAAKMAEMGKTLKRSRFQILRGLKRMEGSGMVEVENVHNRFTVITICNYDTYQNTEQSACTPTAQPPHNHRTTTAQPPHNHREEEGKEGKEGKKVTKANDPFVPPTVSEVSEHCTAKGYTVDAEAFVAHYETCGWKLKRGPMKSWRAACVTWHKNADQFAAANGRPKKSVGYTPIPED